MASEGTIHRRVGDRYVLFDPLGRGGMGTVWRGSDELLQRAVAVKQVELPAGLDDAGRGSVRTRVMREAKAAARLSHPATVTVFDVVEDHGNIYIVMELVDTRTLAAVVDEGGPLSPQQAAHVGLQVLDALEAAHAKGIVHRDVKPANIMVLADWGVKLADFGIASVKDDPSITATGQVFGSPAYMPPEQAQGNSSGPAADWWGLGATLYFAVEGRPPFERAGAIATLTAVVHEEPPEPGRAGPLAPVIIGLLAKEPADRLDGAALRAGLLSVVDAEGREPPEPDETVGVVDLDDTAVIAAQAAPPAAVTAADRPGPEPGLGPALQPDPDPEHRRVTGRGEPGAAVGLGVRDPARDRRSFPVVALVVAAALIGVVSWRALGDRGDDMGSPAAPGSTAPAPGQPEATGTTGSGRAATNEPTTAAASGVPADWSRYTDPKTGYRIAHPPGWQVRPLEGTRTDIRDPANGAYLRVDWTDKPGDSPEGDWERQSRSFGARHDQYQEILIEPTTYRGLRAAIWEYAYTAGGRRFHAVDLGFVTGRYGFALNFQTPEDIWASSQPTFEAFKSGFELPPN